MAGWVAMTGNDWPNLQVHRVRRLAQAIRVSARAGLASVAARVGLASSEQRQRVRMEERKGTSPPIPSERGGDRTGAKRGYLLAGPLYRNTIVPVQIFSL